MAQKITVALEDDLDGGPADETVRFGLGGTDYEIDLGVRRHLRGEEGGRPAATAVARSGQSSRDYTRYDLIIGNQARTRMNKQAAVKTAIQELHRAGVGLAQIKSVTQESRWVAVHPAPGQAVEDAFRAEYPSRSPNHLWYDLGISEGDTTWVIPRFGGGHTEQMLDGLARVAPPHTTLKWSPSDAIPADDEEP